MFAHLPVWVFFAILVAIAQAGIVLSNEYFKVKAVHLLWWMRLISFFALLPAAFYYPWPADTLYYFYVFLGAIIFAYTDLYIMGLAAQSGAGVVTRLEPLIVGGTFILWTAITPSLTVEYLHNPWRGGGIFLALAGSIFFALRLRRCVITARALKIMAPVIVLCAVGMVLGKLAMNRVHPPSSVFYYAFLQAPLAWLFYTGAMFVPAAARWIPDLGLVSSLRDKRAVMAGLAAGIGWMIATPAKWYAISQVENPAYVSIIGMTSPLWVLAAYRLARRQEKADILNGLGIVACAVLLVCCTQL